MTDAMFNLEYMAASLGVPVEMGGISVMEEELIVPMGGGSVTLTETPVAFDGSMIGWYKKVSDTDWTIGSISDKVMTISGAKPDEHYCVKYMWRNENAKSITVRTQYVPKTLHVVIINDLFAGDVADIGSADRYGRLIVDIPRLQLAGNQDLSLAAAGTTTVSLSGNALAVNDGESCEENPYYGTMTQEIFGATWQDEVTGLAVENANIELDADSGTETLAVRVLFGGSTPALRKDNKYFTFTKENNPAATASDTDVGEHTGLITAGSTTGDAVISVKLTDRPDVEPAYAVVTVV